MKRPPYKSPRYSFGYCSCSAGKLSGSESIYRRRPSANDIASVLVPPRELPRFWKFLYRASPITYFIHGSVVTGLANVPIHCAESKLLRISPPTDVTCGRYLDSFISQSGGWLKNPNATSTCFYCPIGNSNPALEMYGIQFQERWHNFGYLTAYVIFNIVVTFGIYWVFREMKTKARSHY